MSRKTKQKIVTPADILALCQLTGEIVMALADKPQVTRADRAARDYLVEAASALLACCKVLRLVKTEPLADKDMYGNK